MNRISTWSLRAAVTALALLGSLSPRVVAQGQGVITGQILDLSGNPWPNIVVQDLNDQGGKVETKTDDKGRYIFRALKLGVHTLHIILPIQEKPFETKCQVTGDKDSIVDLNFKEIVAKSNPQYAEQLKKQEEERQKLEGVKEHFNAGNALLDRTRQTRNDLSKAPADQRDALKQKIADLSAQAVTEFQAAQKAAGEKDTNQPLLWFKLGEAYDLAGRNDDAVNAYQQAVALKSDTAGYYNNLGNALAKAKRVEEAKTAYTKSAELDPPNAATAWKNLGIVLYNGGQYKDALEPLQKALDLEPKNAQTWYLMAACKVGGMDWKKEGDKMQPIVLPGTTEAYEKAIELDPSGPWGQQAKEGLEQLKAMAPGIQTSIGMKKKKS